MPTIRVPVALAVALILAACTGGAATPSVAPSAGSPTPDPTPVGTPSTSPSPQPSDASSSDPGPPALAWAPLATDTAPPPREDHTWTLDPTGRVAYLFGGRDGGTVFDDLWRFDLATDTWTALAPEGSRPEARLGHTGTWVEGVGLVVWSGQQGSTFFDDIWAYDPVANGWRELPADGPVPAARYGSCAALGPDGRLWISHGFTEDSGRFADTQAYDFAAGHWTDETPGGTLAPIRCLHDCLWTPDGRLVLYAGQTTGTPAIGDLWARGATGEWASVSDGPPPARQLYALASIGETAYVFGGGARDGATLRDLWTLDLATLDWTEASPSGDRPSGRSGSAFVADPDGSRLLLFGGKGEGASLGDLWELSIAIRREG
jgi:hypothetical protein